MVKPDFKISTSHSIWRTYKEFLREDVTDARVEEILAFMQKVLETSGFRISFGWDRSTTAPGRYKIPSAANDYLKEFLERANALLPSEMPDEVPDRTILERRAHRAAVFLTFQSRVNLQGETGFVRDVQSILFQFCLHGLCPSLASRGLAEAHTFLLHAMFAHTQLAWTDSPGHQHYLLSSLYDYAGNRVAALELLRASLSSSSVEDHDYITKAQTYWSLLVECERFEDAKTFVLDLYRRAAPKDLSEVQELVDETYDLERTQRRAS